MESKHGVWNRVGGARNSAEKSATMSTFLLSLEVCTTIMIVGLAQQIAHCKDRKSAKLPHHQIEEKYNGSYNGSSTETKRNFADIDFKPVTRWDGSPRVGVFYRLFNSSSPVVSCLGQMTIIFFHFLDNSPCRRGR